jgi:hypothetical protein
VERADGTGTGSAVTGTVASCIAVSILCCLFRKVFDVDLGYAVRLDVDTSLFNSSVEGLNTLLSLCPSLI